jgi:hypothetical protein
VAQWSGTTTFVDAGSARPGIFHGFRRHVIEPSLLRIIPYLNVSFPGIFAVSAAVTAGECPDLPLLETPLPWNGADRCDPSEHSCSSGGPRPHRHREVGVGAIGDASVLKLAEDESE